MNSRRVLAPTTSASSTSTSGSLVASLSSISACSELTLSSDSTVSPLTHKKSGRAPTSGTTTGSARHEAVLLSVAPVALGCRHLGHRPRPASLRASRLPPNWEWTLCRGGAAARPQSVSSAFGNGHVWGRAAAPPRAFVVRSARVVAVAPLRNSLPPAPGLRRGATGGHPASLRKLFQLEPG